VSKDKSFAKRAGFSTVSPANSTSRGEKTAV
jgi:hypothetical protein